MSRLIIQLVTWNGAKYVPWLFDSLQKQTYKDWELLILDNGSSDGMVDAMKKELQNFLVPYELIENKENVGFAGGHNQLFRKGGSDYVLLLNQDMLLMPHCLERLVEYMEAHATLGSISPRLMRWDFAKVAFDFDAIFTGDVDTMGLMVKRNRRVMDMFQGYPWSKIVPDLTHGANEVFGVSGAMPMYRRSAVQTVAFSDGTMFDASYHSYKEDVDLAFRLRSAGYLSAILVDACAFHDRTTSSVPLLGDRFTAENKRTQSPFVRYHSYKNHLMTLYKNEYWQNFLLDFPWIIWYEGKKFVWFLLFDRSVLKGLGEVWKLRKELKKKRIEIESKRKVSWEEMRTWL